MCGACDERTGERCMRREMRDGLVAVLRATRVRGRKGHKAGDGGAYADTRQLVALAIRETRGEVNVGEALRRVLAGDLPKARDEWRGPKEQKAVAGKVAAAVRQLQSTVAAARERWRKAAATEMARRKDAMVGEELRKGVWQQWESVLRHRAQRADKIAQAYRAWRERRAQSGRRGGNEARGSTPATTAAGWKGRQREVRRWSALRPAAMRRGGGGAVSIGGWSLTRMLIVYKKGEERTRRMQAVAAATETDEAGVINLLTPVHSSEGESDVEWESMDEEAARRDGTLHAAAATAAPHASSGRARERPQAASSAELADTAGETEASVAYTQQAGEEETVVTGAAARTAASVACGRAPTGGVAGPSEGDVDSTRAQRAGLAAREAGGQQEWGEEGSSSMRHTHRTANTEERRATTERQEKRAGNGAQRPEDGDTDERHRPLELASCAASTGARWDRQQHRDSNMAAKAAEADHRRQREASEGSGQRDDVQRAPRAHEQEEREKGGSSSSSMGSSSTSCNNTRVHGAHKEARR